MLTLSIVEPYRSALRNVRQALMQHGLRVSVELDIASNIKQELGARVAPCTVLLVDDPALLLEAIVFHRSAALGIPQPVVVSGNGVQTEVFIHGLHSREERSLPATVVGPLTELQERLVRALETIAEREPILVHG